MTEWWYAEQIAWLNWWHEHPTAYLAVLAVAAVGVVVMLGFYRLIKDT